MIKSKITLITTGGTIDKNYDESEGTMNNRETLVRNLLLNQLRLPYTELEVKPLLNKDSLYMTDQDRKLILETIVSIEKKILEDENTFTKTQAFTNPHGIVVLHGTDTMEVTTRYCFENYPNIQTTVVFTGSMKPLVFLDSDGRQNVIEALQSVKLLPKGYYVSFHNQVFKVPNVRKNKEKLTFEST
jgi:L-asparaginase